MKVLREKSSSDDVTLPSPYADALIANCSLYEILLKCYASLTIYDQDVMHWKTVWSDTADGCQRCQKGGRSGASVVRAAFHLLPSSAQQGHLGLFD